MSNVLWGTAVTKYLIIYPGPREEGRLSSIVQHIQEGEEVAQKRRVEGEL